MYPTSNAEDGEKDINLSKLFCECSLAMGDKETEKYDNKIVPTETAYH